MKYCTHCGKELMDEAVICPNCGCSVAEKKMQENPEDAPSAGMLVLGFFLPLVGLILYLVWKDTCPQKSKSAGKGALIGFLVALGISLLSGIITAIIAASVL